MDVDSDLLWKLVGTDDAAGGIIENTFVQINVTIKKILYTCAYRALFAVADDFYARFESNFFTSCMHMDDPALHHQSGK